MNCILFDDHRWEQLLPLTFTRPIAELRIGILKIAEKWNKILNTSCSYSTSDYLQTKYPLKIADDNILINSSVLPDDQFIEKLHQLKVGESITKDADILAARAGAEETKKFLGESGIDFKPFPYTEEIVIINRPWDLFSNNGEAIQRDFYLLTHDRRSQPVSATNNIVNPENIFFEEGVKAEFVTINATGGPVYIGKDCELMEGTIIRGPFAACDHAVTKLAAKIYGPTTLGPHVKVGGELNNVVFQGYSNKAHDGFLGNAVIGEWCNLGADTNNSNLKNNYAQVRLWDYATEHFIKTGLQFCGLIMGDHSKCAINTMFNTGTVIGVSANIFGEGFPRNFVPSFSWGGAHGFEVYSLKKASEVASIVMQRRSLEFTQADQDILDEAFQRTQKFRSHY